jgi:hypothetical protein
MERSWLCMPGVVVTGLDTSGNRSKKPGQYGEQRQEILSVLGFPPILSCWDCWNVWVTRHQDE